MWLKKKPAEVGSDVEEILECIKGEIVGAKDREDDVLELTELVDDVRSDSANDVLPKPDGSQKVKLGGVSVSDDIEQVMHLINSSDFTSVGGSQDVDHVGSSAKEPVKTPQKVAEALTNSSNFAGVDNTINPNPSSANFCNSTWESFVKEAIESKIMNWLEQNNMLQAWMDENLQSFLKAWMKDNPDLQSCLNKNLSTVLRSVVEEKLSKILEKVE